MNTKSYERRYASRKARNIVEFTELISVALKLGPIANSEKQEEGAQNLWHRIREGLVVDGGSNETYCAVPSFLILRSSSHSMCV
mmetsp:Transcript_7883/g.10823  ORF Transcript_7883/g.10823 Transcript_7883/m.10823 type:complete len:84 (+) Transcript_7883:1386-1637(+)